VHSADCTALGSKVGGVDQLVAAVRVPALLGTHSESK